MNEKDGKNVEIERSLQDMHDAVTALKNESNVNDVKLEIGTSFIPPQHFFYFDENESYMDFVAAPIERKELGTRAEHYEEQTRDLRSDVRTIEQKVEEQRKNAEQKMEELQKTRRSSEKTRRNSGKKWRSWSKTRRSSRQNRR